MSHSKTLFLAPEPYEDNFAVTYEIWNRLEQMNIPDLKIVGIQALSQDAYSLVNSPAALRAVDGVWDIHVAKMLALCMIDPFWLEDLQDEKGNPCKDWKFSSSGAKFELPTIPAEYFGLALGGCGRMGTMMAYPWTRFRSVNDTLKEIEITRKNYNLNGLSSAASKKFHPDVVRAAEAVKTMTTTDFTGGISLEKSQKDIQHLSSHMEVDLKFLRLAWLRQISK